MPSDRNRPREPQQDLAPREIEVLQLAADGRTNKEIAVLLGLSDRTVRGYIFSACLKLRVRNRTAAIAMALLSERIR